MIEAEKNEGFEGDTPIQEIEENVQDESAEVNAANVVVTAEEAEDSNNIIEVPAEFAEEDEQEYRSFIPSQPTINKTLK